VRFYPKGGGVCSFSDDDSGTERRTASGHPLVTISLTDTARSAGCSERKDLLRAAKIDAVASIAVGDRRVHRTSPAINKLVAISSRHRAITPMHDSFDCWPARSNITEKFRHFNLALKTMSP